MTIKMLTGFPKEIDKGPKIAVGKKYRWDCPIKCQHYYQAMVLWLELCAPKRHAQALTSNTCECDFFLK